MQLKTKHITQLRALMVSDHPTYDVKSASKDTLVRHMTDAKVNAAKAAENQTLKDSHETLVDKLSDDIKNINSEKDMASDVPISQMQVGGFFHRVCQKRPQ